MRHGFRLFLCAAGMAGVALVAGLVSASDDRPFTSPPNRKGESAWIALRHQRQEANLCVPTSAAIILDYFGDPISPREIKGLAMNKPYSQGDNFTSPITFFRDLIAGLARRGYHWHERTYSNDGTGLRKGLAEIERSLDDGIPVMIDTTPVRGMGHTFVVVGYSLPEHALFIMDPDQPAPGIRELGFNRLEDIWTSRGVGSDKRGALFPQRRHG